MSRIVVIESNGFALPALAIALMLLSFGASALVAVSAAKTPLITPVIIRFIELLLDRRHARGAASMWDIYARRKGIVHRRLRN